MSCEVKGRSSRIPPEYRNERALGSPMTRSAPSSARMMSSIPARSAVPGATRLRAERRIVSVRGSARIEPRLNGLSQRFRCRQTHFATELGTFRHDRRGKAKLGAFGQPAIRLARRPKTTGQANLAEARNPLAD